MQDMFWSLSFMREPAKYEIMQHRQSQYLLYGRKQNQLGRLLETECPGYSNFNREGSE